MTLPPLCEVSGGASISGPIFTLSMKKHGVYNTDAFEYSILLFYVTLQFGLGRWCSGLFTEMLLVQLKSSGLGHPSAK